MRVVRIWDVRPYCASSDRLIKTLMGHQHSFEKVCSVQFNSTSKILIYYISFVYSTRKL